jgi:hypothetical protein
METQEGTRWASWEFHQRRHRRLRDDRRRSPGRQDEVGRRVPIQRPDRGRSGGGVGSAQIQLSPREGRA